MSRSSIRRKTKNIIIRSLNIGSDYPVSVQSMTNCNIKEVNKTIKQITKLETLGCELVRIAFPDLDSCQYISKIKEHINIPVMADIHFDHKVAIEAMRQNIDAIRINPGNIKKREQLIMIIMEAKKRNLPIRLGVNAGSLDSTILNKHKNPGVEAMVEEATHFIELFQELNYHNVIISIKSSDVRDTIAANKIIAKKCSYPLHLGITEAGFDQSGTIKSAIGIGILLYEGIGDTIRVSLSGNPEKEVGVGYDILKSLGLRKRGVNIISCPTCGRCKVDIYRIGKRIKDELFNINYPVNIAIMGCIVNGPGEAKMADIGLAFNKEKAMLFKKGRLIGRYQEDEAIERIVSEVNAIKNTNVRNEN